MNWEVYVRDRDRERVGLVDGFRQLEATLRFNDIGTWRLSVSRKSNKLVELTTPGYGIVVVNADTKETLFSGPIDEREQIYDRNTDTLNLSGWDDNVYLSWRVSHPSPAQSAPPYNSTAYDVRSGVCSTVLRQYVDVNLGPGAVAARREPGLILAADPGVGTTVSGKVRWTQLLTDLQGLALAGGVGFRCVATDAGIEFQVYQPVDRSEDVKFSVPLGNLTGGRIKSKSPEATYVFVGGQGEGTARTIREGQDAGHYATWGRRETFEDRRDTADTTELDQKITETLAEKSEQTDFEIAILDTQGQMFGRDYGLGDKVTAVFVGSESPTGGGAVQELIREVKLSVTRSSTRITPVVATPAKADVFRIFREIRRLKQQVRSLEAR
ncbi:siphovirus ReqiPepy6 Gp37-like family protein [Amycolatopsis palatopharyngis]|uniref:siphovirus ReqiPepy6 Gp37-like family protein n=1 Tax=Amycolatopsis palatopharyngis TaxID=187982 RepID=UPI000E23D024|nr:siphovirus ReqiPepy6 Gp37-like family protein [Amycolatopsis palatopharyngis]